MTSGTSSYLFVKNLQGDITKIIDENDDIVASYTYDAWGQILTESEDSTIEGLNPFRYRGYVYDSETGFYYLQSRYYDPETGRFINADSPEYVDTHSGSPLSTNMFAYCENNVLEKYDKTGKNAWWIQSTSSAKTFGHSSLIIRYKDVYLWYLYLGDNSIQLLFLGTKNACKVNDKVNDIINTFNKKYRLNIKYTDHYNKAMKYSGSFSICYKYFKGGMKKYSESTGVKIYKLQYDPDNKLVSKYCYFKGKKYRTPYSLIIPENKA